MSERVTPMKRKITEIKNIMSNLSYSSMLDGFMGGWGDGCMDGWMGG